MENKKVFLDANILLDIIITERKGNPYAKKLWRHLVLNSIDIVVSEDILTNVFYISKNKKDALTFFELIQNSWKIVPFGKNVISSAIELTLEKNLDLEDVLQCLCAKENSCDLFVTNDKRFYDCGIKIVAYDYFEKN